MGVSDLLVGALSLWECPNNVENSRQLMSKHRHTCELKQHYYCWTNGMFENDKVEYLYRSLNMSTNQRLHHVSDSPLPKMTEQALPHLVLVNMCEHGLQFLVREDH